jgi:ABC-2 type transport system permease protein
LGNYSAGRYAMAKTWVVFKYELINTLTRPSFLLTLFLLPLIPAILVGILGTLGEQKKEAVTAFFTPGITQVMSEGYVDNADLISSFPAMVPQDRFKAFSSENEARSALNSGTISAYYLVPVDFMTTGKVMYIRSDFNPISGFSESGTFDEVLQFNLLGANEERYQRFQTPLTFEYVSLKPSAEVPETFSMLGFYLPYGVTMLFYIIVITTSSLLMNSVTKEKENRVIEVIMSSIEPVQLLTGKILALGLTGLIQMVVWLGSALLILRLGGTTLNIPANMQLPPSLLIWSIIFFLLGYGLYGSVMAGIGAMVPNLREASQATIIVIIPILIPVIMLSAMINDPNGLLATLISIFPLTAPVGMMTRLAAGVIPIWQPILAAVLLLITMILTLRAVAGLFKAQTLLAGQKFSINIFFKALLGKI